MAPEQLGNQPELIDGRADVYALGTILFYILSHSKPFTNTNSNLATLLDLKRTIITFLATMDHRQSEWTSHSTEPLVEICDKAISHLPDNRFSNQTDARGTPRLARR